MGSILIKYRGYVLAAGIALLLVFSFHVYFDKVEKEGYASGYAVANEEWIKRSQENKLQIESEKSGHTASNYALQLIYEGRKIEDQKTKDSVDKDVLEYNAKPEARKKTFPEDFLKTYNKSLGAE